MIAPRQSVAAAAVTLLGLAGFGGGAGGPRIVAVELQPEDPSPGGQFAVVANTGTAALELGCWRVRTSRGTFVVPTPLRLRAGAVALLSASGAWLRATDRIRLVDRRGRVRASTPTLTDPAVDDRIWFRDADGAWSLGRKSFGKGVVAAHLARRAPGRC